MLLAVGCGSSGGDADTSADAAEDIGAFDTATAGDTTLPSDSTSEDVFADASDVLDAEVYGPYPPGPYGNKVGDVLPNLEWQGYVNATSDAVSNTKPFVSTSLDTLRRTARKPYALIHVSDFI
jgi:hypothetical protein